MSTDKLKKYVLLNLPYLLIFWFCGKLGEAYRLASGADFATKLLGMVKTVGMVTKKQTCPMLFST